MIRVIAADYSIKRGPFSHHSLYGTMWCARLALLGVMLCTASSYAKVQFESRLTADVADIDVEYGLVLNHANTIELEKPPLVPPPGNYTRGTMIVAMVRSLEIAGSHEVYLTNSTGNIPVVSSGSTCPGKCLDRNFVATCSTGWKTGLCPPGPSSNVQCCPSDQLGDPGMCLYRWTTTDFQRYQDGSCALWVPTSGLGDIKTIARDDETGKYYLILWGPPQPDANGGSPYIFTSTNHGKSWTGPQVTTGLDHFNPPGTTIHAKDDINFLWQPGVGLVDLQLFWQKNATIPGGYCDNGGCDKRRVLGTMVLAADSSNGTAWKFTGSVRIPGVEPNDPPELQFYRCRPFVVPGTQGTRVFAHTLLYAPSPYINLKYGRQPIGGGGACKDPPDSTFCHGPHMYEEWWTLAQGASAANLSLVSWRRPARFTKMAPDNAYLFAQPGLVGQGPNMKMIWVGSGEIYTLPLHRGVGLYSPANTRVKVPAFDLSTVTSTTQLWINADAHWGPPLPQGGCDETCAAYVLVELEDENGKIIEGYNRTHFNPIMDQDGINLPLRWNNSTELPAGHGNVTVKIWFRAAKVYAVYLGDAFDPAF